MRSSAILLIVLLMPLMALAVPGDILKGFPTPYSCPGGMATDGKYLYIVDSKSDLIYKIDPNTGAIVAEFPAPGHKPKGLAYDGKYLWMADAEEGVILQIDPETKINAKSLWCPAQEPAGLAWDGRYLWLADSQADKLLQVSTEDGTTIKEMKSPSGNPTGLAYDGTYLWVADRGTNRIYMVWPKTGEVIMVFDSHSQYPWGLAIIGSTLYCADYQSDSIYAIITDDDEIGLAKEPVNENCEYTHQVRNYGPGIVRNVNIYLAVPNNSPHQELLDPPVYNSSVGRQIIADQWGQKVAWFHFDQLKPGEMAQASYKTTARIYDYRMFIRPEKVGRLKDIPRDIAGIYLVDNTKYALKSDVIQNAVKSAIGDETNPYWMMRKIFTYVIGHMNYELAGGWNIAPAVLERGNGSCSEYSFVFVAMCRAAGLPARYEGSIVQRGDLASEDDVFHRWCQVYLPKIGWVPVDPSGGDQEWPEAQAGYIGHVGNRYLVTTVGGGGSDYLGWQYNSYETYESEGVCKVYSENIGEWSPADSSKLGSSDKTPLQPMECKPK